MMCGRYVREATPEQVAEIFEAVMPWHSGMAPLTTYNIAPTQAALVVRERDERRELATLRWGLVPRWAEDPSVGHRMINARGETIASRPAYREAFRRRRCLVPATGFYEWAKTGRGKQPYLVRMVDHGLFAFAGLWEHWHSPDGDDLETFTIITTDANQRPCSVHHRMPVMLRVDDGPAWLDPHADADRLQAMLRPIPDDRIDLVPVSRAVNSPRHDTPECVKPLKDQQDGAMLWETGD